MEALHKGPKGPKGLDKAQKRFIRLKAQYVKGSGGPAPSWLSGQSRNKATNMQQGSDSNQQGTELRSRAATYVTGWRTTEGASNYETKRRNKNTKRPIMKHGSE